MINFAQSFNAHMVVANTVRQTTSTPGPTTPANADAKSNPTTLTTTFWQSLEVRKGLSLSNRVHGGEIVCSLGSSSSSWVRRTRSREQQHP